MIDTVKLHTANGNVIKYKNILITYKIYKILERLQIGSEKV